MPANLGHRRTHNLLLISKLLSLRESTSPFTLVLDSLEQPSKPLIKEYIRRANESKTATIFLSFETIRPPKGIDLFITAWKHGDKAPSQISQQVSSFIISTADSSTTKRYVILIDTMHLLSSLPTTQSFNLTTFLSSLLIPPKPSPSAQISLIAIHHTDIPPPLPFPSLTQSPYSPSPLTTLSYLATTLLTLHSLPYLLASQEARDRSLPAPVFGLAEEAEGVIIGLHPKRTAASSVKPENRGVVIELEHRRKSGRAVREWYVLPTAPRRVWTVREQREQVGLLDDHPAFRKAAVGEARGGGDGEGGGGEKELEGLTFDLGLTERQRREREGVVLPYFDAQRGGGAAGPGEGGRILYDMGLEDDFDEEEDEI